MLQPCARPSPPNAHIESAPPSLDVGGEVVTADARTFEPNGRVLANLRSFLERYIPDTVGPKLYTKTCLNDMPPDREFVLGVLCPSNP